MNLISCVFYKTYYYFLLYWILELINTLELEFFETNLQDEDEDNNNIKENNLLLLLYLISLTIGDLFSGFLVIYTKIKMNYFKENKIKEERPRVPYKLIYNDLSYKKNKYLIIVIISVIDFLGRITDYIFILFIYRKILNFSQTNWIISIEIFSRVICCNLILKIKFHKHHIFSLIICFIGFIIMGFFGINAIINSDSNNIYALIYILSLILRRVLYSIGDSISKILLTDKFTLPHELMFWRSFFTFILYIISIPILYFTSYRVHIF